MEASTSLEALIGLLITICIIAIKCGVIAVIGWLLVYLVDKFVTEPRIRFVLRTALIVLTVLIIALTLLRFVGV